MRLPLQCSVLLAAAIGMALASGSKVVEGRIEAVPTDGETWTLRVGSEAEPVVAGKRTRFWRRKAPATAEAFQAGDAVVARVASERVPVALRELADRESWTWLEAIRKGVVQGTVEAFDGEWLTILLADGSETAYRVTEKSGLALDGKAAAFADLKVGQRLWLRGRTLASLDVALVAASDRAIAQPPRRGTKKTEAKGAAKPAALPASGQIDGEIAALRAEAKGFDLRMGDVLLHVAYTPSTTFVYGGARCGPSELVRGRRATVLYRRDAYGRIVAAKVEIR